MRSFLNSIFDFFGFVIFFILIFMLSIFLIGSFVSHSDLDYVYAYSNPTYDSNYSGPILYDNLIDSLVSNNYDSNLNFAFSGSNLDFNTGFFGIDNSLFNFDNYDYYYLDFNYIGNSSNYSLFYNDFSSSLPQIILSDIRIIDTNGTSIFLTNYSFDYNFSYYYYLDNGFLDISDFINSNNVFISDLLSLSNSTLIFDFSLNVVGSDNLNSSFNWVDYNISFINSNSSLSNFLPYWISLGYDTGYDVGYDTGYDAGISDTSGYDTGYDTGYDIGYNSGIADTTGQSWFVGILTGTGAILSIEFLPGITFGTIVFIPLMFGLFWWFLKLVTGSGGS